MNKVIILSVQPQWLEKILNGEKTIEIRKSMPKDCELPIDVYLYCTKAKPCLVDIRFLPYTTEPDFKTYPSEQVFGEHLNSKIGAKFTLNKVSEIYCDRNENGVGYDYHYSLENGDCIYDESCLNEYDFQHYLGFKGGANKVGYAWHIDNLQIFDKPMELREFKYECLKGEKNRCDGCDFYYFNQNESVGTEEECLCDCMPRLTRPFQSWGYAYKEE